MIDKIDKTLCVSCGVCKGSCPVNAIEFTRNSKGQYIPNVDYNLCKKCKICVDVCPGIKVNYKEQFEGMNESVPEEFYIGNIIEIFNAKIKDIELRNKSTCGGMVSGLVNLLLKEKKYTKAFLVTSYNYQNQIKSVCVDSIESSQQSRYVMVSQEELIKYVLENRSEKVIMVGTGCAVSGFVNVINKFGLNRDNYLILGLFCACVLNYNSFNYFKLFSFKKLKNLFFRSKEGEIYPYGMVKLQYDNDSRLLSSTQRAYLKKYMALERCMYCTDLLNILSDISFGDNNSASKDGESNSVIVRTQRGKEALNWFSKDYIVLEKCEIDELGINAVLEERRRRRLYAEIKKQQLGYGIYKDKMQEYSGDLNKIVSELDNKIKKLKWGCDGRYIGLFIYLQLRSYIAKIYKVIIK